MKKQWGTEKDYSLVVDTTAVQTKLKILIRDDLLAGRPQTETNAKAQRIIKQFSSKIIALQSRKEFETSLAQSFLQWYSKFAALFAALQRFAAFNQTLAENVNSMLPPDERFEGITFDESVRNVVTDNARGSPYISEYQKEVKKEFSNLLKELAREEAKTPNGGSLRNVAEVKVRWQANERDLKNMLEAGVRLVWSSSHVDASVRCTPWQGRLYSLDGTSGTEDGISYEPLQNAMLGTKKDGNGLLGYNCRHRLIPYRKGGQPPRDFTEEEMKHARYVDQTQRRLEREIRAKKTEAYLNRGIDPKKSKELFAEARDLSDKYRKFSEENGTTAFMYRTQVTRDEVAYERYLRDQGEYKELLQKKPGEMPETLESFRRIKYNDYNRYHRLIETESEAVVRTQILPTYSKEINPEKQRRHLKGALKTGKSELTVGLDEAQEIVREFSGKGWVMISSVSKEWTKKEVVDTGKIIGYTINKNNQKVEATKVKIHYSKTGVHIVPYSGTK